MQQIILVAETGSDITPELAARYQIHVVPMHVAFDGTTKDDGAFPVEDICAFYQTTGRLPTTSGSTPEDFNRIFDSIHAQWPTAQILYLAYSAVTTCSYQSALIAAEGRSYVTAMDTRQVSVGQANVVLSVAEALKQKPGMSLAEAVDCAADRIARAKMCFLPNDLEFLRAGGRVSNVACLGSRILSLHPCIEILDGKLMATKKYRGKMPVVAAKLIQDYAEKYALERDQLWFVYTAGLPEDVKESAEQAAKSCGFQRINWIRAQGVITTHGGPAAFGLAGFTRR